MQRRFEDALKKLQADLDTKMAQREELKEKSRLKREGNAGGAAADDGGDEDDGEEDDLFGDESNVG